MLALDFLSTTFADGVLLWIKMTRVCAPFIGVVAPQTERIEQRFQFEEYLIFPAAKDIRQYRSGPMINGMPEPARIGFAANKRPHFIYLGFPACSMSTITSSGSSVFNKAMLRD